MINKKTLDALKQIAKQVMTESADAIKEFKKTCSPEDLATLKRHEKRTSENAKNSVLTPLK